MQGEKGVVHRVVHLVELELKRVEKLVQNAEVSQMQLAL